MQLGTPRLEAQPQGVLHTPPLPVQELPVDLRMTVCSQKWTATADVLYNVKVRTILLTMYVL